MLKGITAIEQALNALIKTLITSDFEEFDQQFQAVTQSINEDKEKQQAQMLIVDRLLSKPEKKIERHALIVLLRWLFSQNQTLEKNYLDSLDILSFFEEATNLAYKVNRLGEEKSKHAEARKQRHRQDRSRLRLWLQKEGWMANSPMAKYSPFEKAKAEYDQAHGELHLLVSQKNAKLAHFSALKAELLEALSEKEDATLESSLDALLSDVRRVCDRSESIITPLNFKFARRFDVTSSADLKLLILFSGLLSEKESPLCELMNQIIGQETQDDSLKLIVNPKYRQAFHLFDGQIFPEISFLIVEFVAGEVARLLSGSENEAELRGARDLVVGYIDLLVKNSIDSKEYKLYLHAYNNALDRLFRAVGRELGISQEMTTEQFEQLKEECEILRNKLDGLQKPDQKSIAIGTDDDLQADTLGALAEQAARANEQESQIKDLLAKLHEQSSLLEISQQTNLEEKKSYLAELAELQKNYETKLHDLTELHAAQISIFEQNEEMIQQQLEEVERNKNSVSEELRRFQEECRLLELQLTQIKQQRDQAGKIEEETEQRIQELHQKLDEAGSTKCELEKNLLSKQSECEQLLINIRHQRFYKLLYKWRLAAKGNQSEVKGELFGGTSDTSAHLQQGQDQSERLALKQLQQELGNQKKVAQERDDVIQLQQRDLYRQAQALDDFRLERENSPKIQYDHSENIISVFIKGETYYFVQEGVLLTQSHFDLYQDLKNAERFIDEIQRRREEEQLRLQAAAEDLYHELVEKAKKSSADEWHQREIQLQIAETSVQVLTERLDLQSSAHIDSYEQLHLKMQALNGEFKTAVSQYQSSEQTLTSVITALEQPSDQPTELTSLRETFDGILMKREEIQTTLHNIVEQQKICVGALQVLKEKAQYTANVEKALIEERLRADTLETQLLTHELNLTKAIESYQLDVNSKMSALPLIEDLSDVNVSEQLDIMVSLRQMMVEQEQVIAHHEATIAQLESQLDVRKTFREVSEKQTETSVRGDDSRLQARKAHNAIQSRPQPPARRSLGSPGLKDQLKRVRDENDELKEKLKQREQQLFMLAKAETFYHQVIDYFRKRVESLVSSASKPVAEISQSRPVGQDPVLLSVVDNLFQQTALTEEISELQQTQRLYPAVSEKEFEEMTEKLKLAQQQLAEQADELLAMHELEKGNAALTERLALQSTKIAELEQQQGEANVKLSDLDALRSELAIRADELNNLRAALDEKTQAYQLLKEARGGLKDLSLSVAQNALAKMETEVAQQAALITTLQNKVESQEVKIAAKQQVITDLRAQLAGKDSEIAKLSAKQALRVADLEPLQKEAGALRTENAALLQEIGLLRKENPDLKSQLAEAAAKLLRQDQERSRLQQKISETEKRAQQAEERRDEILTDKTALEALLARLEETQQRELKKQAEEAEVRYNHEHDALESLRDTHQRLSQEFTKTAAALEEKATRLDASEILVGCYKEQIEQLKAEREQKDAEFRALETRISEQEMAINDFPRQVEQFEAEILRLTAENSADKKASSKALQVVRGELEEANRKLAAELLTTSNELADAKKQLEADATRLLATEERIRKLTGSEDAEFVVRSSFEESQKRVTKLEAQLSEQEALYQLLGQQARAASERAGALEKELGESRKNELALQAKIVELMAANKVATSRIDELLAAQQQSSEDQGKLNYDIAALRDQLQVKGTKQTELSDELSALRDQHESLNEQSERQLEELGDLKNQKQALEETLAELRLKATVDATERRSLREALVNNARELEIAEEAARLTQATNEEQANAIQSLEREISKLKSVKKRQADQIGWLHRQFESIGVTAEECQEAFATLESQKRASKKFFESIKLIKELPGNLEQAKAQVNSVKDKLAIETAALQAQEKEVLRLQGLLKAAGQDSKVQLESFAAMEAEIKRKAAVEISQLRKEIEEQGKAVAQLTEQLQGASTDREELGALKVDLEARLADLEQQLAAAKNRADEAEAQEQLLRSAMEAAGKTHDAALQTEAAAHLVALDKARVELNAQHEAKLKPLNEKLAQLQTDLKLREAEVAELKNETARQAAEIGVQQETIRKLQASDKSQETLIRRLRTEASTAAENRAEQIAALEKLLADEKRATQELQERLEAQEALGVTAGEETAEWKSKFNAKVAELAKVEREWRAKLEKQVGDAERKLSEQADQLRHEHVEVLRLKDDEYESLRKRLSDDVQRFQSEAETLKRELAQLRETQVAKDANSARVLSAAKTEHDRLLAELKGKQEQALKALREQLTIQTREHRVATAALHEEADAGAKELQEAHAAELKKKGETIDKLRAEIADITAARDANEKLLQEADHTIHRLRKEAGDQASQFELAVSELTRLRTDYAAASKSSGEFERSSQKLREERDQLSEKISQLEKAAKDDVAKVREELRAAQAVSVTQLKQLERQRADYQSLDALYQDALARVRRLEGEATGQKELLEAKRTTVADLRLQVSAALNQLAASEEAQRLQSERLQALEVELDSEKAARKALAAEKRELTGKLNAMIDAQATIDAEQRHILKALQVLEKDYPTESLLIKPSDMLGKIAELPTQLTEAYQRLRTQRLQLNSAEDATLKQQADIKALRAEIEKAEQDHATAMRKLQGEHGHEVDELTAKHEQALAPLRKEVKELEESLRRVQDQYATLSSQLIEKDSELGALVKAAGAEKSVLQSRIETLQLEIADRDKRLDKAAAQITALEAMLAKFTQVGSSKAIEEDAVLFAHLKKEMPLLQERLQDKEVALARALETQSRNERELEKLRRDLKTADEEGERAGKLDQQVSRLELDLADAQRKLREQVTAYQAERARAADLAEKLAEITPRAKKVEQERNDLRSKLSHLEAATETQTKRLDRLSEELKETKRFREEDERKFRIDLDAERKQALRENERLQSLIDRAAEEMKSLRSRNCDLLLGVERAKQEAEGKDAQHAEKLSLMGETHQKLRQEIEQQGCRFDELQQKKDALQQDFDRADADRLRLLQREREYLAALDQLNAKLVLSESQRSDLIKELAGLEESAKHLKASEAGAKSELAKLQDTYRKLDLRAQAAVHDLQVQADKFTELSGAKVRLEEQHEVELARIKAEKKATNEEAQAKLNLSETQFADQKSKLIAAEAAVEKMQTEIAKKVDEAQGLSSELRNARQAISEAEVRVGAEQRIAADEKKRLEADFNARMNALKQEHADFVRLARLEKKAVEGERDRLLAEVGHLKTHLQEKSEKHAVDLDKMKQELLQLHQAEKEDLAQQIKLANQLVERYRTESETAQADLATAAIRLEYELTIKQREFDQRLDHMQSVQSEAQAKQESEIEELKRSNRELKQTIEALSQARKSSMREQEGSALSTAEKAKGILRTRGKRDSISTSSLAGGIFGGGIVTATEREGKPQSQQGQLAGVLQRH